MKERVKAIGRLLIGKSLTPEQAFLRGLPMNYTQYGTASTTHAYENSAVAYACIRRIAVDAGNAPFLLLSNPEDPESIIPDSHPIAMLFAQPNPWFETNQFMEYIYTLLMLRGEFFIVPDKLSSPKELIQFYDPRYWEESTSQASRLLGYKYNHQAHQFTALPSELIHHKLTNVVNPFRGQSPLQAAASALWTEVDGDNLTASIMARGGEQGIVYSTEEKLLPTQEEELQAGLRARRAGKATVANDTLLTGGMTILDPKFTGFDYQLFDRMGPAEQKIVQVYGLSSSLIGRDDEPNYATFQGRLRIYWRQTLLPLLNAVESTLNEYINDFGVHFYYDKANIQGLQEDLKEQAQIAAILNKTGIPWDIINTRLNLKIDMTDVPGSDDIMVNGNMAPLSVLLDRYEYVPYQRYGSRDAIDESTDGVPDREQLGEEDKGQAHLPDYPTVLKRSKSIESLIARNRKLAGLERAVAIEWRKLAGKYKDLAVAEMDKAISENRTADQAAAQFADRFGPVMAIDMAEEAVEAIMPRSIQGAGEGEVSVEELTKRLSVEDIKHFSKEPYEFLSPKTLAFILERENLVRGMSNILFDGIMAKIWDLVTEGGEISIISGEIRMLSDIVKNSFNASINRAQMIGRTEIGTAFNVGRFNNMVEQGYRHHEWLTNIDEFTRETHEANDGLVRVIGDEFPNGLAYPQEPSGPPEEVINCRCLTIPITEEQYEERR